MAPGPHTIAVNVLHHHVEAVAARAQWNRLPIEPRMLQGLFQQVLGDVDLYSIFESLSYLSRKPRHPTENVDRSPLNAIFADKRDVLALDLQRHRHQHRIARYLDEIGPNFERHQIYIDLVADNF